MKYLRTKDKVIELPDNYIIKDGKAGLPYFGDLLQSIDGVIKESDKLEDLLDEYVIVNNADEKPFRLSVSVAKELEQRDETGNTICQGTSEYLFDLAKSKLENIKKFVGNKKKHDKCVNYLYEENPDFVFEGTIKGAIWTKTGLIYVADIDKNGDLYLL